MEAKLADLQAEVKRLHDKLQKVEGNSREESHRDIAMLTDAR